MKEMFFVMLATLAIPMAVAAQPVRTEAKIKSVPLIGYPQEAMKTGLGGEVKILVDIDQLGHVTKAFEPIGPDWICPAVSRPDVVAMRQIAVKAALDAVFDPATEDGKPTASQMSLKFKFTDPSPHKATSAGLSSTGYRIVGDTRPDSISKVPEPSEATRDTKTIGGGVLSGSVSSIPQPAYPSAARAVRASGTVGIQVVIDTNGTIFSAEAVSGHPLLRSAARNAACNARFLPTMLSGEPVMVSGIINYNFVLP